MEAMGWLMLVLIILLILLVGMLFGISIGISIANRSNQKKLDDYRQKEKLNQKTIQLHEDLLEDSLEKIRIFEAKRKQQNTKKPGA